MKNITLSVDEDTLKAGREYARKHNISLNALVRLLLRRTVQRGSHEWVEECFRLMDNAAAKPSDRKWKRGDLYRV